jgi:hypothetical protein
MINTSCSVSEAFSLIRVPLKTIAPSGEMDFRQIWLAKDAGCLAGSQGFCKAKMAEIQPPDGDESF